MMSAKLLGFPHAGERWNWTGHAQEIMAEQQPAHTGAGAGPKLRLDGAGWSSADGSIKPRRTAWGILPKGLSDMSTWASGGDITGAGGSKRKQSRAVGVGDDPDMARAGAVIEWLEAKAEREGRARLMADLASEREIGQRLLTLAGGAGWGDGKRVVTLQSGGMAARAARYIMRGGPGRFQGRGVAPSDTSLQEAAAAAAACLWFEWQCYSALHGDDWTDRAVSYLAGCAWRAAHKSLTRDASEGRTGRKAGQPEADQGAAMPLEAASLAVERESLQSWARDRQVRIFAGADQEQPARARRARRAVLEWLRRVLVTVPHGRRLSNGQREQLKAQRGRLSVLARLIHGRDWRTASRGAGFASGRAAAESFQKSKTWAVLRTAAGQPASATERKLVAVRKRAARRTVQAIKRQRAASPGAGRAEVLPPVARRVRVPSGTATATRRFSWLVIVRRPAGARLLPARGLAGRGAVHPLAAEWSSATAERGAAASIAKAARGDLHKLRGARLTLWDKATKGLRAGWLNGHKAA